MRPFPAYMHSRHPNSSATPGSRPSRLDFLRFHRRNSTASARSASETQSIAPTDMSDDGMTGTATYSQPSTPEQRTNQAFDNESVSISSLSARVPGAPLARPRAPS